MMKKILIITSVIVLLSFGTFILFTNKTINLQKHIHLVLKHNEKKQNKKAATLSTSEDKKTEHSVFNTKTIDSDFELRELASDNDTTRLTDFLKTLQLDLKSKNIKELNQQYFLDDNADYLKYDVTNNYSFDFSSLKVHNTKKEYLLEWAIYINKYSLKKRVVGTFDKNMNKIKIIEIK